MVQAGVTYFLQVSQARVTRTRSLTDRRLFGWPRVGSIEVYQTKSITYEHLRRKQKIQFLAMGMLRRVVKDWVERGEMRVTFWGSEDKQGARAISNHLQQMS
jgi:hypothetical protein